MADRNIEALVNPLYMGNGANRVKVDTDGTLTTEGNAVTYNDIRGSLFGAKLFEGAGKVGTNWDEQSVEFDPNGDITKKDDRVAVTFQLPHDHMTDSPVNIHIHWRQTDATPREFTVEYRGQANGQTTDLTWTQIIVTTGGSANKYPYTSGNLNQITDLFNLTTVGIGLSAVIQVRLTRSDAVGGVVLATFVDGHYQVDSLGSTEEYVK